MAQVYILGAGTPTPTLTRFGAAHIIEVSGDYLMFDCGPAATYKLVKVGLFPTKVDYLFFTHHHFDHDVDYPCFLLCRWDQSMGRENEIRVYGPTLTETITLRILGETGAFVHDWKARVNHPLSQRVYVNRGGTLPRNPPIVRAKDVGPGIVHSGRELGTSAKSSTGRSSLTRSRCRYACKRRILRRTDERLASHAALGHRHRRGVLAG